MHKADFKLSDIGEISQTLRKFFGPAFDLHTGAIESTSSVAC